MAAAQFETWVDVNLQAGVRRVAVPEGFFTQDHLANKLGVRVYNGAEPVNLYGDIRWHAKLADGTTVSDDGEIIEYSNMAYAVLKSEAYACVGPIAIAIQNIDGDDKTVLAVFIGYVHETVTDQRVTPGNPVPDIDTLLEEIGNLRDATTAANNIILVQDTQPENATGNKIWVQPTSDEYQVPTWEEFQRVESVIDKMNSVVVDEPETPSKYLSIGGKAIGAVLSDIATISNNWNYMRFKSAAGDRYRISGISGNDAGIYAFTDEGTTPEAESWNGKGCVLLEKGPRNTTVENLIITAPADGWLLVNHNITGNFLFEKLIPYAHRDDMLITPSSFVTKNVYVQNGYGHLNGRDVYINNGVIRFVASGIYNRGFVITNQIAQIGQSIENYAYSLNELAPIDRLAGANVLRFYYEKNTDVSVATLSAFRVIFFRVEDDTITKISEFQPTTSNGLNKVAFDIPQEATHYAFAVFQADNSSREIIIIPEFTIE